MQKFDLNLILNQNLNRSIRTNKFKKLISDHFMHLWIDISRSLAETIVNGFYIAQSYFYIVQYRTNPMVQ